MLTIAYSIHADFVNPKGCTVEQLNSVDCLFCSSTFHLAWLSPLQCQWLVKLYVQFCDVQHVCDTYFLGCGALNPQPVLFSHLAELNLLCTQVPVAVACSAPEARVQPVLETTGLWPALEAVVTAEDVYRGRPDPEAYLLAAQRLQRPPVRCVVIGNSNQVLLALSGMCRHTSTQHNETLLKAGSLIKQGKAVKHCFV